MARDLVLDVITHSEAAGLREAGRELDNTAARADHMGQRFHEAGRENGVLTKTLVDARNELKRMEQQLASTGDTTLLKGITSQRSLVSRLDKVVKDLAPAARTAGQDTGSSFFGGLLDSAAGAGTKSQFIGALVGIGVAAAPMLGAVIGGAVTGAVGLGGIAGGIAAAASDPAVKGAWQILTADASIQFKAMGAQFVGPTVEGIKILDAAVTDMHLDQVFAPAAGFVTTIAHGVADMASGFSSGFGEALSNAGPVMQELATDLGDFGRSFGQMLSDMSQGEGNAEGLRTAFALLDGTMVGVGKTVEALSTSYHNFIATSSMLSHDLAAMTHGTVFEQGFNLVANSFDSLAGAGQNVDKGIVAVNGHMLTLAASSYTEGQMALIGADYHRQQAVQTQVLRDALAAVRTEYGKLLTAASNYVNSLLGMKSANLSFNKDLLDIHDQLKQNGKALDDHSKKGIANSQFFLQAASDAEQYRQELIKQGVPLDVANAKFQAMIKSLEKSAIAAGFDKTAVHALLDQLLKLPGDIPIKITFKTSGYGSALDELASFSGAALSGGVVVTAHPASPHGFAPARASGGPVWPGQDYIVGEQGAERFRPLVPGRIEGAGRTVSASASGGPLRIAITLDGTGLAQNLKADVRGEGGVDVYFESRR